MATSDARLRAYKYRCRLCGELHNGAVGTFDKTDGQVVLLLLEHKATVKSGLAMIGRQEIHHCADGGVGISDIQGFRDHDESGGCGGSTVPKTMTISVAGVSREYTWDSCEGVWRISQPDPAWASTVTINGSER